MMQYSTARYSHAVTVLPRASPLYALHLVCSLRLASHSLDVFLNMIITSIL